MTKERTLPVLEAAHIRPYSDGGEHRVDNGLLLRSDLHTLFDRGYVTVTPYYCFEVSRKIKQHFENGRDYYALDGRELWLPMAVGERPAKEYLEWHRGERWLGPAAQGLKAGRYGRQTACLNLRYLNAKRFGSGCCRCSRGRTMRCPFNVFSPCNNIGPSDSSSRERRTSIV